MKLLPRKKYWVYEVDTFIDNEITPQKCFRTMFFAKICQVRIAKRMSTLGVGSALVYKILEVREDESFVEAHMRIVGLGEWTYGKYKGVE